MAIRKYDISLDTKVRISNVVIRGRLGDGKGSIVANVTVFNDGQRYNFTGLTPQYEAKLPDGLNIIRDKAGFSAVKATEGSFTYEFPAELFSAEGYAKASYFTFLDAKGSKQSTFDIAVEVVGMALAGKLAETYVSEIDVDLKGLSKEVTSATTAANKVIADIAKNNVVQQKDYYPLISGAGTRTKLANGTDILTLKSGFYEVAQCKNSPFSETEASWKNVDVVEGISGRKMLRLTVSAGGATFYKTLHTNGDDDGGRDWWRVADAAATQNVKITEDDGRAKVYIDATMDVYEELPKLERGFYSVYISAGARNSPSVTVRGSVFVEDKAQRLSVQGVGSNGKIYSVHYTDSVWIGWLTAASESIAQIPKITNDDGSTIILPNYDLLNTTDVSNFDGYSNTAINMPTGISQAGYIKRKYRGGFIEVTYSPCNTNAVYRNSYNSVSGGNWLGWEKLVTASELAALESKLNAIKPVVLWSGSANGVSSTPYALSRAINTSRKIRVTYDYPGASGKTAVVDLSNTKILIIHDFNLADSDANGGVLFEFQLDFTALNRFTIKADTVKDLNSGGKIDQKNITVRKIEEVD